MLRLRREEAHSGANQLRQIFRAKPPLKVEAGIDHGLEGPSQTIDHESTYRYSATDLTDGAPACSNSSRDGSNFP